MNKAIIAIVVIIVIAGAFYGGTAYEKNSLSSQGLLRNQNNMRGPGGQGRSMGINGQNRNAGAGDFAVGEIISKDDKSITIKTRDGGSKIIYFSDSTTIGKSVSGAPGDLNTGQQVMANGKNSADGSMSAQNIQIRPDQPNNSTPAL